MGCLNAGGVQQWVLVAYGCEFVYRCSLNSYVYLMCINVYATVICGVKALQASVAEIAAVVAARERQRIEEEEQRRQEVRTHSLMQEFSYRGDFLHCPMYLSVFQSCLGLSPRIVAHSPR